MMSLTCHLGFSDAYGSWKTIWMSLRNGRSCLLLMDVSSRPSNFTEPDVGLCSCRIARPVVDLPQPDSPTRPSVSPGCSVNDTPDTACTVPTLRGMIPLPRTGNSLTRSVTSSSGAVTSA